MSELIQQRPRILMFDGSNILYKTFYANANEDAVTTAGMAHHAGLTTLNKYYKLYKPDTTIVAFDRSNWRKAYTKTDACVSKKPYKGNRRLTMTPKQQEKYAAFCEHIAEFEELLRKQTGIVTLARDGLEADDLMAGVAQLFHETHDIIIISADKDLMQLLRYPSVVLIDPATGKPRTLVDHKMDADLFMFVKCIRGDAGDNVQSAFPRVRMTRIMEAYTDPYARANLMEETWTDETGRELKVKDLFAENELLMDLAKQPPEIRESIEDGVLEGFDNKGTFNHFHFLRFCGKFGLVNISNSLENFVKMLT